MLAQAVLPQRGRVVRTRVERREGDNAMSLADQGFMSDTGLRLKPPNPDHLDRMQRVTTPLAWLALLALATMLAAGGVWSLLYKVPVKVAAQGIILPAEGVVEVPVPASGRLIDLLVREGDHVTHGQVVAHLLLPEIDNKILNQQRAVQSLTEEKKARQALLAQETEIFTRLFEARRADARARIAVLTKRVETLNDQQEGIDQLFRTGTTPRDRLIAITADATNAAKELADAQSSIIQLEAEQEERRARAIREILELDMKVATARRELDNLEADRAAHTVVHASADGLVVEEVAEPGDIPAAGEPILRVLPGAFRQERSAVTAVLFLPPADGKKVRPDMQVQVIPTVVKVQKHGYMLGAVAQVTDLPASRERMAAVLRNDKLVEQLSAAGAPYMAFVSLTGDPATPSGFAWSTGRGPDRVIDVGTMIAAHVVVERVRVISLVVPLIETMLGPMGL